MKAQRFDIGMDQARFLACPERFRKRRNIAAWKDLLASEGVSRARPADATDGVDQHDAIIFEQIRGGPEKGFKLRTSDMFEHPDRNDPVEPVPPQWQVTIVDQFEGNPIRDTGGLCPIPRKSQLFF